jgi:hypothetical protein
MQSESHFNTRFENVYPNYINCCQFTGKLYAFVGSHRLLGLNCRSSIFFNSIFEKFKSMFKFKLKIMVVFVRNCDTLLIANL